MKITVEHTTYEGSPLAQLCPHMADQPVSIYRLYDDKGEFVTQSETLEGILSDGLGIKIIPHQTDDPKQGWDFV